MDIRTFIKKHNIIDPTVDHLDAETICKLNRIVSGNIEERYDDPMLENYAGSGTGQGCGRTLAGHQRWSLV